MIRILIADDHAIVRRGLKQIVSEQADMIVASEAENAREVLDLVRTQEWDVVVLDINMPGRNGLEVLKELKRENPKLPVLILSIHPEEQYGVRVLKAGAAGYLTKDSAPDELVLAIRKVHRGGKYISASLGGNACLRAGRENGRAQTRNPLGSRVSGNDNDRVWKDGRRNRRGTLAERKDHKYIPHSCFGQDEYEN